MSKRIIISALALICVVGLGITAWWLTTLPEGTGGNGGTTTAAPGRQRVPTVLVDREAPANTPLIQEARVELRDGDDVKGYTVAPDEDGFLRLDTLRDLPVNASVMQMLLSGLAHLETADTVDPAPASASDYGFGTPTATVRAIYSDGAVFGFALCPLPLTGDSGYYMQVTEDSTSTVAAGESSPVYLMSNGAAAAFLAPQEDYVALDVWLTPDAEQGNEEDEYAALTVRKIQLTGTVRDQVTVLRRREQNDRPEFANDVYIVEKPYLMSASSEEKIMAGVTSTNALVAAGCEAVFPTEEQMKEFGLDQPYSVAAYTLAVLAEKKDQTGETVASRYHSDAPNLVKLGKKNAAGQYYAQINQVDAVYLVNPDSVPWASLTYQELVTPNVFLRAVTEVARLDITHDGRTTQLQLTHYPEKAGDEKLVVTANGEQLDTADFRKLYQMLMGIRRTGAASAQPEGAPIFKIELTPIQADYMPLTISIYAYSASSYIACTEQGDTFKVAASNVDTVAKQYERYLAGDIVVM